MRSAIALALLVELGCGRRETERAAPADPDAVTASDRLWAEHRSVMVDQIAGRGVDAPRVLEAMRQVPRHELVPRAVRDQAYADRPLPIGHDQTISQPYIVAVMSEAAEVEPGDRVLEVGTGSGYQAAVLAELGATVYSIEIVEPLAKRTATDLERLGYGGIHLRIGDGYRGWPEAAPFDAVIVTAAPPEVPQPLVDQLAIGGRLVIPVGEDGTVQELRVITRVADGTISDTLFDVRFVPMTGEAQRRP